MNKESNETQNYLPEYFPNRLKGACIFNKKPDKIPKDVLKLIGEKGVREIHKKLTKLIKENKEHFGNRYVHFFGLFYYQEFLDIKSRVVISVCQMIDNKNPKDKIPYTIKKERTLPSCFSPEKKSDKAMIRQIKSGGLSTIDDDTIKYLPRVTGFH